MNNTKSLQSMTNEELIAHIQSLTKAKERAVSFKVSEKGAVSVYGLGRFPVTLYASQWTKLFEAGENLKKFLEENKSKLSTKENS